MLPSYYDEYPQRVIRSARGDPRECVSRLLHELYTEPGGAPSDWPSVESFLSIGLMLSNVGLMTLFRSYPDWVTCNA